MAGTTVKEAIQEASELARKLNLAYCCFNFNGVGMSISQNCDIEVALKDFDKVIRSDSDFRIVVK